MFSAVYLVCFLDGSCSFFVDQIDYETKEECSMSAENNIFNHQEAVKAGQAPPHTAEYQCVSWVKA